ncbi:unnamed protein product [Closterium sp. NIES-64]|nr:unnamed protein product [Closterium sp. NIES-64]
MCPGGANTGLPIHSLLFANSIFEDLEPALAAESVHWPDGPSSGAPRAPPKFSAGGWSRLTQALSNSRALTPTQKNWEVKRDGKRGVAGTGVARTSKAAPPSKSAAASKPRSASRPPPSLGGAADPKTDGEPALLLLPDGSVQIVTSPHSVAESRSPKLAGDEAAGVANDDRRRPTRASDVLQNHLGCQVGSLTSSNGFLRPQQVMKPGHVYFLQPPQAPTNAAALPAPDVNRISPGDDESAAAALTLQRDSATNADHGAAGMHIEAEEHALDDPPLLSLDRRNLSPSPMPSIYRTPCTCCSAKRPTTPTSHFSPVLTHSLTLSPTSSAATNSTFPSPMLSPRCPPSPPSPSPSLPCPTNYSSRPKVGHFFAVPEDLSFQLDNAAAQIFATAAQERAQSPLMHRGWCTAGRSIHPQFSTGIGCNECDNDASATTWSYSARHTGVKLATSTGFPRVSSNRSDDNNDSNGIGVFGNRHRRSYSRGLESTGEQLGEENVFENAFERRQVQRPHNPFRLHGRPVVTVEDMVFGRVAPSQS